MPGPIPINEGVINPLSDIATKNAAGQWVAGPNAPGYDKGQFIPTQLKERADGSTVVRPGNDVGRAYTNRQRTNLVKANMRRNDLTEKEARKHVREELDNLRQAQREGDTERIRDVRKRLHGS